jgi:hypothetical protein
MFANWELPTGIWKLVYICRMLCRTIVFILFPLIVFAQKGGRPTYPVLTREEAVTNGYVLVNSTQGLLLEIQKDNSKIFISESFELTARAIVSGNNVVIESDKKSVITSKLWFTKFRYFESFAIEGKNVTFKGLRLKGDDCDIGMLDHDAYQAAIRCHADSFHIINCDIECFGWAAIYGHRYNGMLVEQCYLARNKSYGYGYGVWFEGAPGSVGIVKDCIFEDNRESVDAGGHMGAWTITGCVTDRVIRSHNNPNKKAGIGETITGNYFLGNSSWGLPAPSSDTGWIKVTGNYFMGDSTGKVTSENPKAKYVIKDNHYRCGKEIFPETDLFFDLEKDGRLKLRCTSSAAHPFYQIDFGDGTREESTSATYDHTFQKEGSYTIRARSIGKNGVAGKWKLKKFRYSQGHNLTCALKTSSRYTPPGYYSIQVLVDSSVLKSIDATELTSWKRFSVPIAKGRHKIEIRLLCLQDSPHPIMLLIDDVDVNGTIPNADFEYEKEYHPPQSNWRQSFKGSTRVGSGIDFRDRASGNNSWRFEMRTGKSGTIAKGQTASLYHMISVN